MPNNYVKQIADELSRIFRHMFPGLAILGVAIISHPGWFPSWSTLNDGWHIAILGAIALTVGNAWYVVHRYTLHQFIDYCLYVVKEPDFKFTGYLAWLGGHIDRSFHVGGGRKRLSEHVHFRSAQIIFLFIIAEAIVVFSIKADPCTFIGRYRCLSRGAGIAMFLFACIQYYISYSIDVYVSTRYGGDVR
jgi:hypothetical protein